MSSDLKPVYLIAGSDRPKVQRAVERLKGHFDPAGIEHLSAETASGDEAVAACNSLGLFATGGRLVLVTVCPRLCAQTRIWPGSSKGTC